MSKINLPQVAERFLKYVSYPTTSNPESKSCPSTSIQMVLAREIARELEIIGLTDIRLDNNGYLTAIIPANTKKECKSIGFIAHLDTSPDYSGENIKAVITSNYSGNDIILNEEEGILLSPKQFPALMNYKGQTIISTNGKTLLGADNKAGVASIVTTIEYLMEHPEIEHGKIFIGFTPDEEIGRGADKFPFEHFKADFAYTIDGGEIGELQYENFNAAEAIIKISGLNIHPGEAKNKMKNAMTIGAEFIMELPINERPECTENYQGFFHLTKMITGIENTELHYIIRDFEKIGMLRRKTIIETISNKLNEKYGQNTISFSYHDQYFNMREVIENHKYIIELAKLAMQKANVVPKIIPIRGGTDGARLSFLGLPCPNIFTGGHNFHGKYEFIPVESMEKTVEVILNIVQLNTNYFDK